MSTFDPDKFMREFEQLGPPSSRDGLFKSGADARLNACVNWCPPSWGLLATGYKRAADKLATGVEERPGEQDVLVYPILFLYRQYFELSLKQIIRSAQVLLDLPVAIPMHHNISILWADAKRLLNEACPHDSVEELRQVGRIMNELTKVDPESAGFRYPVDKEGNPTLPGISRINISNVRQVAARVAVMLDGAATQIGVYQEYKYDMESDSGPWEY